MAATSRPTTNTRMAIRIELRLIHQDFLEPGVDQKINARLILNVHRLTPFQIGARARELPLPLRRPNKGERALQ